MLAGSVLATGPGVATAARAAEPVTVGSESSVNIYSIQRTSKAPRRLQAHVTGRSAQERGAVMGVGLVRSKAGWALDKPSSFGYVEMGPGQTWISVYGPASTPACPTDPLCSGPLPRSFGEDIDSEQPKLLEYFITTAYATAEIELRSSGWRIREIHTAGFRRMMKEDAQATGVDVVRGEIEHFTSASAPGGRYGSNALAGIPCDSGGYGEATLTGGRNLRSDDGKPARLRCDPPDYIENTAAAEARGPTTWRLDGDVWGIDSYNARLIVFDYPKP